MEQEHGKIKRLIIGIGLANLALLLMVLVSLVLFWKPWDTAITANTRKITITGEATTKAEPDQFQFNPSYKKDTTDEITKLNDQIVAKLKALGLTDSQIKNNASSYGSPGIYIMQPEPVNGKNQTTLNLTITVNDKKLAQKVQDYLLTTNPEGSITPTSSFSTAKQKTLENKVRSDAIADARTKADQTAQGLGVKIGKVISVTEGSSNIGGGCYSGGIVCPMDAKVSSGASSAETSSPSISVQPGTDEFTYDVSVIFELN